MATGCIFQTRGDAQAVTGLLKDHAVGLQYLLEEQVEAVEFARFEGPPERLGPRGRAFGVAVEVRWRELAPGDFDVLVLKEAEQAEPGWERYDIRDAEGEKPLQHYLWGTWRGEFGGWVEARLPDAQHYPLEPPAPFATVEVVEYSRAGIVQFTRYRALRGEEYDG